MANYFFLLKIKNLSVIHKQKWPRCIYAWLCVEGKEVEGADGVRKGRHRVELEEYSRSNYCYS